MSLKYVQRPIPDWGWPQNHYIVIVMLANNNNFHPNRFLAIWYMIFQSTFTTRVAALSFSSTRKNTNEKKKPGINNDFDNFSGRNIRKHIAEQKSVNFIAFPLRLLENFYFGEKRNTKQGINSQAQIEIYIYSNRRWWRGWLNKKKTKLQWRGYAMEF